MDDPHLAFLLLPGNKVHHTLLFTSSPASFFHSLSPSEAAACRAALAKDVSDEHALHGLLVDQEPPEPLNGTKPGPAGRERCVLHLQHCPVLVDDRSSGS